MKKGLIVLAIFMSLHYCCRAQLHTRNASAQPILVRETILSTIQSLERKDTIFFFPPKLPPLGQIAGAPQSYYNYFWELGDGSFSFDENPSHIYRDMGTYTVRLFVTNNFDNGKAPAIKPYTLHVTKKPLSVAATSSYFFNANIKGNIGMKNNRDPLPGEDFVTVIGYRNKVTERLKGSVVIFYNEKEYDSKSFALEDKRIYHREETSTLNSLLAGLQKNTVARQGIAATKMKITGHAGETMAATKTVESQETTIAQNTGSSIYTRPETVSAFDLPINSSRLNAFEAANSLPEDTDGDKDTSAAIEWNVSADDEEIPERAPGDPYNSAEDIRSMLRQLKKDYTDNAVFRFDSLGKGNENFIFMTMNAAPAMPHDTDAVITLTGVMIPDDPFIHPEKFELEMQVVASHDPNRFLLRHSRMGYRFLGKKRELSYQVRFQNTGKGPARKVAISIGIPRQLDPATLQIKKISPLCDWCTTTRPNQSCVDTLLTGDSLYFTFRNIYIPGMQQRSVKDKDSTKGFVEYSMHFLKKPKKIPFGNRAKIVFDKNEPIYTNRAMGRFKKGFSPGIVAGYNFSLSNGSYSAKGPIQIGYILAPFSPWRPYFQVEAYLGLLDRQDSAGPTLKANSDTVIANSNYLNVSRQTTTRIEQTVIQLVPLHFRYNLNDWVSVGIGALAQVGVGKKVKLLDTYQVTQFRGNYPFDTTVLNTIVPGKSFKNFSTVSNVSAFADLQVGRVRTGPTIGLRYLRQLTGNIPNRFFVYAAIKI